MIEFEKQSYDISQLEMQKILKGFTKSDIDPD